MLDNTTDSNTVVGEIDQVLASTKKRNKHIRIADKSDNGWKVIDEYLSEELASDSEDEKRIRSAQARAARRKKNQKAKSSKPSPKRRPATREMQSVLWEKRSRIELIVTSPHTPTIRKEMHASTLKYISPSTATASRANSQPIRYRRLQRANRQAIRHCRLQRTNSQPIRGRFKTNPPVACRQFLLFDRGLSNKRNRP